MRLPFKKLHPDAILPTYGSAGAAGMDVHTQVDFVMHSKEIGVVSTGLAVAIPEGFELQCRPRSGLATRGIGIVNAPGTIDSDYRGEIKVILINHSSRTAEFVAGDRIAQLVLAPVTRAEVVEVDELDDTERGAGGFGSTGK
jgi:dUTP pyrophosphatase